MDPYLNPFSPGAGQRPPELAGRTKIIEEAIISLRRALAGRSFRPMLFLGLRGTGKTVLLNELANQARDLGFLVSRLEAPEKADLVKMLYPEVKKIMRSLSTVELTKDLASRGMQAVKRFAANLKIEVGGVEISVEPHEAHGDSVDLETELPDLFESIGTVAKAAKKGWLLSPVSLRTGFLGPHCQPSSNCSNQPTRSAHRRGTPSACEVCGRGKIVCGKIISLFRHRCAR